MKQDTQYVKYMLMHLVNWLLTTGNNTLYSCISVISQFVTCLCEELILKKGSTPIGLYLLRMATLVNSACAHAYQRCTYSFLLS